MPNSIMRVGGGYTAFSYKGKQLVYVEVIQDTAPAPVAAPQAIQPLNEQHPIEIAFPVAHGAGTLVLTFREQWESEVWQQLEGFESAQNIVDVFKQNINNGSVDCTKTILLPGGAGLRVVTYHGCVVTNIDESETIEIGTMTLPKRITLMYTHKSRGRI